MKSAARDSECRFTPAWQPGADANLQRAGKQPSAALTREVRGLYHLYVCPTCLWYNRVLPLLRRVTS